MEEVPDPVWRTAPGSASLSLPESCWAEPNSVAAGTISFGAVASSHASSPTALGRAPSAAGSKPDSGTFTVWPSSVLSVTISRGTSRSTTFVAPSGVCTVAFFFGARLLNSLYASNS